MALAGLASPVQAALGPSGTFVNETPLTLILTFDGSQSPGNHFHLITPDRPGLPSGGPGTPAGDLERHPILLGPQEKLTVLQDSTGVAGAFAFATFRFEVPGAAAGSVVPAAVTFLFDYPASGSASGAGVPAAGSRATVAVMMEYEAAGRPYRFEDLRSIHAPNRGLALKEQHATPPVAVVRAAPGAASAGAVPLAPAKAPATRTGAGAGARPGTATGAGAGARAGTAAGAGTRPGTAAGAGTGGGTLADQAKALVDQANARRGGEMRLGSESKAPAGKDLYQAQKEQARPKAEDPGAEALRKFKERAAAKKAAEEKKARGQ